MTDRSRVPNRSAVDLSAVVPWVNDAGEEIPAFGVVQLRTDFDTTSHASKPDSTSGLFFVNGPVPVASAKRGESFVWNKPRVVLLDAAASVGDEVGPTDGSWEMSDGGVGFRVLQQAAYGRGVVVQVGGGGSGGGHTIWFTIDDVICPDPEYDGETILVVTATHYNQSCTGTPPGVNYDGSYDVYDNCSYLRGLVEDDLLGATGRATYMYPLTGYCEPRWIIDDLCPAPECA